MNSTRQIGRIKTLDKDKKFGFIHVTGSSQDVFFHLSGLQQTGGISFDQLEQGMTVSFTEIAGPRGPRAIEVALA